MKKIIIEEETMNYKEEKLKKAQKAVNKTRDLAEIFCPTDGWLKEDRAIEANKWWQEMRTFIDKIGVEIAKEIRECKK